MTWTDGWSRKSRDDLFRFLSRPNERGLRHADADLGRSETAYGFGARVFFLACFLFEASSNVITNRVGARI